MPVRPLPIALFGILLGLSCCAGSAEEEVRQAEVRSGRVRLLVPAGKRGRSEYARLAAELDRAASEMAPRIGTVADASPLTILIEEDHVAQARSAGEIGEAVAGPRADLHLVWHPDDLPACRFALARVLLARAGIGKRLPPWLERGAALWLSRDWYGRTWSEWLPLLARARVLPEAEQLLLAPEAPWPRDSSTLLWTPAAAGVVERLPGTTVAEKLREVPSRERVAALLAKVGEGLAPSREGAKSAIPATFLKGVSLAMLNRVEEGYHAPAVDRQLARLQSLGANAVAIRRARPTSA